MNRMDRMKARMMRTNDIASFILSILAFILDILFKLSVIAYHAAGITTSVAEPTGTSL